MNQPDIALGKTYTALPRNANCGLLNVNSVYGTDRSMKLNGLIRLFNIDIMFITETKIKSISTTSICLATPAGTHTYLHQPRDGIHRAGGVGLILLSEFMPRRLKFNCLEISTFEFLAAEIIIAKKRIVLLVVYRPPSASIPTLFYDEFGSLIETISENTRNIIAAGDFNINMLEHTKSKLFLDALDELGLKNNIFLPTFRSTSNNDYTSSLDLLIEPLTGSLVQSIHIDEQVSFSDHFLITFNLNLTFTSNKRRTQFTQFRRAQITQVYP